MIETTWYDFIGLCFVILLLLIGIAFALRMPNIKDPSIGTFGRRSKAADHLREG